ncbi:MAG: thiol reductant ABC exporter subunit CydC [Erysipelotrichaceae bacterium]|nr:thiol reductant ABC exporter subunit CydC [Erysipelotrichaceae bacterium]
MKYRFRYSLKEMTVRLFALAKPIRFYLVISTLASIFGNLAHMGLMGFGVLWILSAAGKVNASPSVYIVMTVISAILIPVCRYLEGVFSHIGAYGILAKMRVHLFEILERVSPAYLIDNQKGDILNIAVSDIETLEFFFAHTIGPMFTVIILPLTTLLIAAHYNPLFAWILLPVYIMISVVIPLGGLKLGRSIGMRYRRSLGTLKSLVLESVYGIRDIQIFGHGNRRAQQIRRQNDEVSKAAHGMTIHREVLNALPNFFVYLARIFIIAIAAKLAAEGKGDPAGTVVISFVAAASFSSTFSLTFVVSHLLEAYAAAERFFIIEDTVPAVRENENPAEMDHIDEIRFNNVSFRYPSSENNVLDHTSFTVHKGEKIGIYGESGIGKSTIMRLLLRFYDPASGSVMINRKNLKDYSFAGLHSHIALMEQETSLFDATIAENIAFGKPAASKEEIITAAKRAGIADFIETLPEGYETQMGQMAARLSGGERQRIGIARVLLSDPDVILMDEPSSSLDVFHEKELLQTIHNEYQDKTVIIISHRMSTLGGCEKIFRLINGRMYEEIHY